LSRSTRRSVLDQPRAPARHVFFITASPGDVRGCWAEQRPPSRRDLSFGEAVRQRSRRDASSRSSSVFPQAGCCRRRGLRDEPLLTAGVSAEIYGMVELSGPAIVKVTVAQPRRRARASGAGDVRRSAAWRDRIRGESEESPAVGISHFRPYRARVGRSADGKPLEAGDVGESLVAQRPRCHHGLRRRQPKHTARSTKDGWALHRRPSAAAENRFRPHPPSVTPQERTSISRHGPSLGLPPPRSKRSCLRAIPRVGRGAHRVRHFPTPPRAPAAGRPRVVLKGGSHGPPSSSCSIGGRAAHIAAFKAPAPRRLALIAGEPEPTFACAMRARRCSKEDALREQLHWPRLMGGGTSSGNHAPHFSPPTPLGVARRNDNTKETQAGSADGSKPRFLAGGLLEHHPTASFSRGAAARLHAARPRRLPLGLPRGKKTATHRRSQLVKGKALWARRS